MRVTWLGLLLVSVVGIGGIAGSGCGNVDVKNFCAPQLTRCADTCVDTMGDPANCGACGNACGAGQACVSGACTCTGSGGMFCGGACVDTKSDTANCGTCGTTCGAGEACSAGTCTATCGMPFSACTNATSGAMYCADLANDAANCGTCGTACPVFSGCSRGVCSAVRTWQKLTAAPAAVAPTAGMSDYTPPDESSLYLLQATTLVRYDRTTDTYTTLAAAPIGNQAYQSFARVGKALWVITNGAILSYDIAMNTWTVVVPSGVHPNTEAQTTHDASGKIYTFTSAGEVAIYDTVAGGSVTYVATTILNGLAFEEPRLAFDDSKGLLFIAPNFIAADMFSFDPATGTVTKVASSPGTMSNPGTINDAFCSDRQGHLYSAGSSNVSDPSFFVYDIATDTWTAIPSLPFGHGNDGACTVMAENGGYLYMVQGDSGDNAARIALH